MSLILFLLLFWGPNRNGLQVPWCAGVNVSGPLGDIVGSAPHALWSYFPDPKTSCNVSRVSFGTTPAMLTGHSSSN